MADKILKVGMVGLGQRGMGHGIEGRGLMGNVLNIDGVVITALCDRFDERLDIAYNYVIENGDPAPLKTKDYEELLDSGVDAVIVSTSWDMHVAVALSAMKKGVVVAIEVGGTHSIDDCWALVDCYEQTKTPFMFLENCCYNKDELLASALLKNGVLGDISFCQGYYCHDLREEIIVCGLDRNHYRLAEYRDHNCENYPTHELGPIAKMLSINRGNKFKKLVSMASKAQGLKEYLKSKPDYAERLKGVEFKQGDVVTTMIECENGETVLLKLDTTLPRLYERGLTVSGTKGFYCQTTKAVILDNIDHEHTSYASMFNSQDEYSDYVHEDWKNITKEQIEAGHGGMDYIMLKHFFETVKRGEEMPIDVYDACSWMCVTALSEQSIAGGSVPVEFPDFTRGKFKDRKPVDVLPLPIVEK